MSQSTTKPAQDFDPVAFAQAGMKHDKIESFRFEKSITIDAPIEITWAAVLDELGPESAMPDGTSMKFKLEAWPGGRWYRDLGNNAGHFWAFVQVIKPPKLLELAGPMFMSYPATQHIQYRLVAEGDSTKLTVTNRGMGLIPPEHIDGMDEGWEDGLKHIQELAAKRLKASK